MKNSNVLLFLFITSLTLTSFIKADERILSFQSQIQIFEDGSMQVEENIKVRAEQNKIRRGIFRDFPTRYNDRYGNNVHVKFEVTNVLRDGLEESFHTESKSNGIRLYIGNKDHFLASGEYNYTVTYRTSRQLGFFEDHDELYWNVTGNGWIFPIDTVTSTVQLPGSISSENLTIEGYTGRAGAKGQDYQSSINYEGNAQFKSTKPLLAYEGLTIVVSWPKGFITEPDLKQKISYILNDNLSILIGLSGLVLVLIYYLMVWNKVGRDPEQGVVFPHYTPERGFSPASMRYISRMGYDHKVFASAVVNLAVKGAITINEYSKAYTLNKTTSEDTELAAGEAVLMAQLFEESNSIILKNKNHRRIQKTLQAHKSSLKTDYQKLYFRMNSVWLLPSFFVSIATIIAAFIIGKPNLPLLIVLIAVLITLVNIVFYRLLKSPTLAGRKLLDKIDGFKMYLEVAEKDELNLKNPPEKTPEIFEAYLPYAMALNVEQDWASKFSSVFAKLQQQGHNTKPHWYHGSHWNSYNLGNFTSAVGSSLSSAISSSSSPPGSSSGSGGGGSSGGGGGGGGGGGW